MLLALPTLLTLAAVSSPSYAADWRDAMATGACNDVVAALPSPATEIERLALARCLDLVGEDGRAAELAAGITDKRLAPYARYIQARALVDRDRASEAVTALDGVNLSGSDDELLRGRALVLAHRSLDARDGLRALLEVSAVAAEARYWLAWGAEDRGEKDAAIGAYRAVWTKAPMSPWSTRAAERLEKLGNPVPNYATDEGRSLALERAKTLIATKQAPEAVELLVGIHAQVPFASESDKLFYADALFEGKAYAQARDIYNTSSSVRSSASVLFQYALATARAGDYPAAEALYGELVRLHPDSSQADEASWKPGYMHHDAGRLPEAIAGFDAYLAKYPSGKFAVDARWFRAWDLHRMGKDIEAINAMESLQGSYPQVDLAIASRYWRARLKGDTAGLEQVISLYPDSGYAWFASQRLGKTYPKTPEPVRPQLASSWIAARSGLDTAILLVESGMADWGRPLMATHSVAAASTKETAVPFAWLLVDAEDYGGAKKLACPHKSDRAALVICVIRPHRDTVEAVAQELGLNPLLPYAIMNAESGVDPSVTSPAGAMGLMQLMPRLAGDLAKDRIPGFYPEQLYRAGVNARLGTTELGLLASRFQRSAIQPNLPLVIAGYNGGSSAVERWMGEYKTPPQADEFAENISFAETRRYVRRVLGYLQQYRRAYGDS